MAGALHTLRGPIIRSPTEGPNGRVRMAAWGHFGTPLTEIVAPQGAPPKAPLAGFAWRPRATRGSWPRTSSTEGASGSLLH
eukprot:981906-Pyramimonas_sp.AAC.1